MFIDAIKKHLETFNSNPQAQIDYYSQLATQAASMAFSQASALDSGYYQTAHCTKFTPYGNCQRQMAYKRFNIPASNPPDAHVYGIFVSGNMHEVMMNTAMVMAGFEITAGKGTICDGQVTVRPDGVLWLTPEQQETFSDHFGTQPAKKIVIEYKSLNNWSFKDLVDRGLYTSKPQYYKQVQLEMTAMHTNHAVLIAINKNNGIMYEELIILQTDYVSPVIKEIESILAAYSEEEFPRKYDLMPQTFFVKGKKNVPASGPYAARTNKKGNVYGYDVPLPTKKLETACAYCSHRALCWAEYDLTREGRDIIATKRNGNWEPGQAFEETWEDEFEV